MAEAVLCLIVLCACARDCGILDADLRILPKFFLQLRAAATDHGSLQCVDIVCGIVIGGRLCIQRPRRIPRPRQLRLCMEGRIVLHPRRKRTDRNQSAAVAVCTSLFQRLAVRDKRGVMKCAAIRRTIGYGVAAEDIFDRAEVCRRGKEATRRQSACVNILCMNVSGVDLQFSAPV